MYMFIQGDVEVTVINTLLLTWVATLGADAIKSIAQWHVDCNERRKRRLTLPPVSHFVPVNANNTP